MSDRLATVWEKISLWVVFVAVTVGVIAIAWGVTTLHQVERTVSSHDTELKQTLQAACILIKSDPHLPIPKGCIHVP